MDRASSFAKVQRRFTADGREVVASDRAGYGAHASHPDGFVEFVRAATARAG